MPLIRKDTATPKAGATPGAGDLLSASEDMRWRAARQLAKDPASVAALAGALALETSLRVREAIFTSLAHIQTPEAIAAIVPHIRSQDAAIRAGALDAMASIAGGVELPLAQLMSDPDPDIRLLVCDIVRRLPAEAATVHLCALLAREQHPNVCGAAVEALMEVGDASALPVLAQCAERFAAEPFLQFSIKAVSHRIVGDGFARETKTP